ncbi:MAG: DNA glycosylase AlkZ-like family protein, partial [Chloroflexia bacterium]
VASKTGLPHLGEKLMSGWGELLKPAAYHGYICFGPSRGQSVTFMRPDQWIGAWHEVDPQEALRELARRYLSAYGPATHSEFARWFGVDPAQGRRVFAGMQDELTEVSIVGTKAQALERDLPGLSEPREPPPVRLLPNFDPYTVAAYSLRLPLTDQQKARVSRAGAWISPIVLVEGRLAGIWKQEKRRGTLALTVELFEGREPLQEVKNGIAEEAERTARFLGIDAEVAYGTA